MTKHTDNIIDLTRSYETTAANTFRQMAKPPVFVKGSGASLWTDDGQRYIDLVCGSAVTALGHGDSVQTDAIKAQLETGVLHTGTRLPAPRRAELYGELARIFPDKIAAFQLANAGSEAVEVALKSAQYATGRRSVIAFYGGYHGRTMGALSVTATKRVREPFLPLDANVHFFPYPYPYRPPLPGSNRATIGEHCLEYLRNALINPVSGLDRPSAMIVEAIQGVAGVVVPPPGFLTGLREICQEFDILMIVDEIWNGFGRTGKWFGFDHDGIVPDLVTIGKAFSGSLPLSGVAGRSDILQRWPGGMHTSTFQGNPLACAAAVASIRRIRDDKLLSHAGEFIGPTLVRYLSPLQDLPHVGEVRVIGAIAGIELVDDDGQPAPELVNKAQNFCLDHGVLVYAGGWYDNVLMLVVPLVIDDDEMDQALSSVVQAITTIKP